MCMFSRTVAHVAATRIFARGLSDGRQALAYAMQFAAAEDLAMILPIPVPPGSPDDAVEMVDLSGYAELFDDMRRAFPAHATALHVQAKSRAPVSRAAKLVVQRVGAFDASFVPRPADFKRLDARFRLAPDVLAALPQYADWGFVVFQLRRQDKPKDVHPMAFRFPRRDPDAIFFPTVHVHDGRAPEVAHFDHLLFAQLPPLVAEVAAWTPSDGALGAHVDGARAQALVDPTAGGQVQLRFGDAPNRDVVLRPPAGVTLADLSGAGASYRYHVRATYHFAAASHPSYPKWRDTATRLARLAAGIRAGLAELTATNARAWQLGPLHDGLEPHFMNGSLLQRGRSYTSQPQPLQPGPGLVAFRPFSELVEPQDITLAFAEMPTPEDARDIDRALSRMLDRVVS